MGKILSINLDEYTANYILKLAQTQLITPSEVIRRRIYNFFNVPRNNTSQYLPRYHYAVHKRYVVRVYLPDYLYDAVIEYTKKNKISLAEFIRKLFMVEVVE